MATRTAVITYRPAENANGVLAVWSGLLNGDDGSPFVVPDWADRTVQFDGTFGVGGTIKLQGSNDNVTYFDLTDPQGNAISKTAAGLEVAEEAPLYIKPIVTAGDGTTSLRCLIFARRGR